MERLDSLADGFGFADDPLVPLHLLVWAVMTALTTATCLVQVLNWEGLGWAEKKGLLGLYVPYLLLGK